MNFLLKNDDQYSKSISAITGQELLKGTDLSGFKSFIDEIKKAIDAKLKVEMKFEATDNIVTKHGFIDFCSLDIDDSFTETHLSIHLAEAHP